MTHFTILPSSPMIFDNHDAEAQLVNENPKKMTIKFTDFITILLLEELFDWQPEEK